MEKVEGGAPDKVKSSVARSVCVRYSTPLAYGEF
jgi:hypothetical protein